MRDTYLHSRFRMNVRNGFGRCFMCAERNDMAVGVKPKIAMVHYKMVDLEKVRTVRCDRRASQIR